MSFLHVIFRSGAAYSGRAAAAASRLVWQAVAQRAVNTAIDSTLGVASDVYDFWAGASQEQIQASSAQAMAESLVAITDQVDESIARRDDALVDRILTELNARDDGAKVLAEVLDDRVSNFTFPELTGQSILAAGEIVGCVLGEMQGENNIFKRTHFANDSKPANFIRRCSTKSSDGKRVSREPHEWAYVRSSGQWGRIMQLAMDWATDIALGNITTTGYSQTYLDAVADAMSRIENGNLSTDQSDYTFGNFVDMRRTRKALERYRKLQRLVRSANSKEILLAMGSSQLQFSKLLEDRGRWLDVLEDIVNQNVRFGSGQGGTTDEVQQLDATPGTND